MGVTEAWSRAMLEQADLEGDVARLAEEACAGADAAQAARACAALRDAILERCEQQRLSPRDARALCSAVDEVQVRALQHDGSREVATARFRDHFVGIVSHDLRNPLTAILTSAQLALRHGNLDGRQARMIARIASSAERMARMIDDLLDFTRSRLGGGFPIHPRRMDLREVTEQAVEELIFAHPGREVQVAAQGDLWGSWDRDRMAQVVSNLVGNAIKHGDGGEVRVTLRGEREGVALETHNGGAPIPADVLPHVFEPGRRGSSRSGGLGLGLFIAQQIVLAHRGSIEVRSAAQEGTTFTVLLPRHTPANASA